MTVERSQRSQALFPENYSCIYDGYHFSENGADVFNPYSLFHTFRRNDFDSYWFSTGTPTFLIELLKEKGIDMLQMEDI